jgi:predicted kinase
VRRRLYSRATTRKTYVALLRNAKNQVKERRSLILDATFSRRRYRDQLRQQLDRAGVAFCFVEVQASEETSKKRLEARERKARELSDARLEDFETLNRSYEPPLELDLQYRITVDTEHSLEATVAETLKALTERSGHSESARTRMQGGYNCPGEDADRARGAGHRIPAGKRSLDRNGVSLRARLPACPWPSWARAKSI